MINNWYYKLGVQPSAIRELFSYGLERKAQIGQNKVFDFSLGNPNVPAPKQVKRALKKILNQDPTYVHSYSPANGYVEARTKVAYSYNKEFNFPAEPQHVFLTCGAAPAIKATMNAIVGKDEEIILVAPYFAEYKMWADDLGCSAVEVLADKNTFQLDVPAIKNAITQKTAAIIINSPNNPTGVIYSEENIKALAQVLKDAQNEYGHPIYIISDEPYRKITFGYDVPFVPSIYNNTIICYSLSKTLSIPGERIGHVYVSSTADEADKVYMAISGASRALGHVCAPTIFQQLYSQCFDIPANIKPYMINRDLITQKLDELAFEYVQPQGAFYLWIKSPYDDAKEFSEVAKKFEILLVPSDTFGVTGWVRLGYCVSKDTIKNSFSAWEKLAEFIRK